MTSRHGQHRPRRNQWEAKRGEANAGFRGGSSTAGADRSRRKRSVPPGRARELWRLARCTHPGCCLWQRWSCRCFRRRPARSGRATTPQCRRSPESAGVDTRSGRRRHYATRGACRDSKVRPSRRRRRGRDRPPRAPRACSCCRPSIVRRGTIGGAAPGHRPSRDPANRRRQGLSTPQAARARAARVRHAARAWRTRLPR